jgi:hypothetical protein
VAGDEQAWYDRQESGRPIPFWARLREELRDPYYGSKTAAELADDLNAPLAPADIRELGPNESAGPADLRSNGGKVQRRASTAGGEISNHPVWMDLVTDCPGAPNVATADELDAIMKDPRAGTIE